MIRRFFMVAATSLALPYPGALAEEIGNDTALPLERILVTPFLAKDGETIFRARTWKDCPEATAALAACSG
ncbi:hypothetical protein [Alkalilimnicola ehrlichii]|uniref:Uncharacterized protein n=1 Tax=Alkalilimnicola ehrlichii TaxID=351052 RepID=A0A3E0WKX0_9GAMM|nr:hypothetical protein [Alkalilimnicola ehrlichii]RFA32626.1 hypothetical protein CAL65_19345 [Alkalilimnicola ehrlichii]